MGERRRATGTTFSVPCFFAPPRPAGRGVTVTDRNDRVGGVTVVSGGQWLNLKASLLQSYPNVGVFL